MEGQPLDERKQRILRAVVEEYVRHGDPVGSKGVADVSDLGVSSATVRNEMAILEREGYISHPHTSAGRVPTDKGYRYYVDQLARPARIDAARARDIEHSLMGTLGALDELLQRASGLLADLTEYTGLASSPPATEMRLRSLELVPLGGRRLLLILVGDGARHEQRILELPAEPSPDIVRRAVETANRMIAGRHPSDASDLLESVKGDESALLKVIAHAVRGMAHESGRLFTGGASRMIAWEAPPLALRALEALEGGEVTPLLPASESEGVDVRIGRELPFADLQDMSLISARYAFERYGAGALGVLGPTRMDYPSVISLVAAVARSLSEALRRLES